MNLQQLRYVLAAVRNEFNLTNSAESIFVSQSSISKQIKDLEIQLGFDIFIRKGKRLTGLTEMGEGAVALIERIVDDVQNLQGFATRYNDVSHGRLAIAASSNIARNILPEVIRQFGELYPKVAIELSQGSPAEIMKWIAEGDADLAIATDTFVDTPSLLTFPYFSWRHVAIVSPGHPLIGRRDATLADIARYPLITYDAALNGRRVINAAFDDAGLVPDIRLTAMDADVIAEYAALGFGIGTIAEIALRNRMPPGVVTLEPAIPFFPLRTAHIALRKGRMLRSYAFHFVEMLSPDLKRSVVETGLRDS